VANLRIENASSRPTRIVESRITEAVRRVIENRRDCEALGLQRFSLSFRVLPIEDVGEDRQVRLLLDVLNAADGTKAGEIPNRVTEKGAAGNTSSDDDVLAYAASHAIELFLQEFPRTPPNQVFGASGNEVLHDGAALPRASEAK
jgi:hypothetical protein